jgi:hypothetical protein
LTIRFTNYNLEQTFRESSRNSFFLLSFLVEQYSQYEKVIEETVIEKLREKIVEVETGMLLRIQKDKDIHGIWL